jgi:ribosomal protein L32
MNADDGAVTVAVRCPFCGSSRVSVNAKATALTYRRCDACGELWHPDRVTPARGAAGDRFDWTIPRR